MPCSSVGEITSLAWKSDSCSSVKRVNSSSSWGARNSSSTTHFAGRVCGCSATATVERGMTVVVPPPWPGDCGPGAGTAGARSGLPGDCGPGAGGTIGVLPGDCGPAGGTIGVLPGDCGPAGGTTGILLPGDCGPVKGRTPGDCGSFGAARTSPARCAADSPNVIEVSSRIRSTMLPPNTANARCATVSPTAGAITALTASRVSWFAPAAALACCSKVATRERSCALKIRSSCINVSEKESRICFEVIGDTPPCVCTGNIIRLGACTTGEEGMTIYRNPVDDKKYFSAGVGLPPYQCTHHRLKDLHAISATQFGLGRSFRMRHHAHNIATRAADTGDVIQRAIGIGCIRDLSIIGRIAKYELILAS